MDFTDFMDFIISYTLAVDLLDRNKTAEQDCIMQDI